MIIKFIQTDEQWKNGVALEEYEGKYSITRANEGKDGKVYAKWGYPQKGKSPIDTAIPWKVELGSKEDAIEYMKVFLAELGWRIQQGPQPIDDSDIPF